MSIELLSDYLTGLVRHPTHPLPISLREPENPVGYCLFSHSPSNHPLVYTDRFAQYAPPFIVYFLRGRHCHPNSDSTGMTVGFIITEHLLLYLRLLSTSPSCGAYCRYIVHTRRHVNRVELHERNTLHTNKTIHSLLCAPIVNNGRPHHVDPIIWHNH